MSTICSQMHPLPRGTQNRDQPKKQFWPWRCPKCDQNQLWHVNITGKLHQEKKLGSFGHQGLRYDFLRKKKLDRSIDLAVQHIYLHGMNFCIHYFAPLKLNHPEMYNWFCLPHGWMLLMISSVWIKVIALFLPLSLGKNINLSCCSYQMLNFN